MASKKVELFVAVALAVLCCPAGFCGLLAPAPEVDAGTLALLGAGLTGGVVAVKRALKARQKP